MFDLGNRNGPEAVNSLAEFFIGKRVLITGATGFKGAWLAFWLYAMGAELLSFAKDTGYPDGMFNLCRLHGKVVHISADVRDAPTLLSAFQDFRPDIVFHLAAQPLVRVSYQEPKETFDVNVMGSVNVLEAVRQSSCVRSLIYVTSDKCYRNEKWVWGYRENDVLGGRDPYSASKAAAELAFAAYLESFFRKRNDVGVASVRAGNVIGGGDWSLHRIVPDCIRALISGQAIHIRHPHATRPWQHVFEPIYGYLILSMKLYEAPTQFSGSWNFGFPSDKSVGDLVEAVVANWGVPVPRVIVESDELHEDELLKLNCDKARRLLNWQPRWDFDTAVAETVTWYREHRRGQDMSVWSQGQIHRYLQHGTMSDAAVSPSKGYVYLSSAS